MICHRKKVGIPNEQIFESLLTYEYFCRCNIHKAPGREKMEELNIALLNLLHGTAQNQGIKE